MVYSREKFEDCVGDDVGTGAGNILVQSQAGLSGTGDTSRRGWSHIVDLLGASSCTSG